MKAFREKAFASKHHSASSTDSLNLSQASTLSEKGPTDGKHAKASFWSSFVGSPFTAFDVIKESSATEKKATHYRRNGWTEAVKRLVAGGSMRRLHELILGPSRTGISNSTSHLWLLGLCYKILSEDSYDGSDNNNELAAFMQDFSSRILMTYRKGFVPIKDSKYTSDVNWGCMIRSSQMLVAQALLFHRLGRSWRRNPVKQPMNREYNEILRLFGDSEASAFSIYNLLEAGKSYGLAAGSWVGPYAMCRSWQTLAHQKKKKNDSEKNSLPMAIYVVSGDEDGERGGAPVVCIEDASRHCFEFSNGQLEWTPILLLVPLVLGLEKINPRYIPSLGATFTFPQSLGILGGKPGNSTYLVGVQDEKAFYLDPHEVQPVIDSSADNLEVDTSSYHCSTIRHVPLDSIDPSLAIGFYCRDKGDFDDFCSRATDLAARSSGAPLFTVVGTRGSPKPRNRTTVDGDGFGEDASFDARDDDWQLL